MLRKTLVVLGASLALVLGTGGAALADEPVAAPPTDVCVPSEGSPAVETTYKQVPNPDYVPGKPGVHHPAETHEGTVADQRYSWNPQGSQDELTVAPTWPTPAQGRWTANTSTYHEGDPIGVVWFRSNGGNTGAYFYWTTTTVTVEDKAAWDEAAVPSQGEPTIRVVDVQGHDAIPAVTCDAASLPLSGIDIPTCEVRDVLPLGTNLDTRGWVLKPNSGSAYVEGGLGLDGTVGAGSAWARLDLPAGTHLSDVAAGLGTDLVSSSGIWWGGMLLEGGDLTAQLHYDTDGRFWTSQQGVLPDASLKGGYYESSDLAADALVDPTVGSVRIYVNEGQSAVVGSQDIGCSTQPFAYQAPRPELPEAPRPELPAAPHPELPGTPTAPATVDEVLAADSDASAEFYSEVLSADGVTSAELADTGSDGVAITLGSALLLVLAGLSLTVIRRRATR